MNVVPLNGILMVLLVVFMIIPTLEKCLDAQIAEQPTQAYEETEREGVVVVQVMADGPVRINQRPVTWETLGGRLEEVFKVRASRTAFIRGDAPVEFGVVAKVIDLMRTAGIASVGLLTPDLEKGL